ncbi:hypothetical protein ORV05_07520 [Amycolatopsis cynarae]|uniref:Peptidase C39-like domain-containing protein n=1 Tax=Amycolatopsis cynarae TaxID=2995223 RepID=A0ABY7B9T3_9PSEU|nr:hypothetical protein [Amycolatopsis sp. HUAS 11-8]WAL67621.1 hypothetical protein ORV05_07520 [Amycolatopsis sp. HUAS 11-8]
MLLLRRSRWFPGAEALVAEARAEMPQKNDLCGAFAALVSVRAYGIPVLDQDEAAVAAGVRLAADPAAGLPPGEKGRDDYRVALPRAGEAAEAGASAGGVARAVEILSSGRLKAVPASGDWKVPGLHRLLQGCHQLPWVALVANVDTGEFGAHDTPERALTDYLEGGLPPMWNSRWRTGHFVLLAGTLHGPGGTLVSVVDTYPGLGDRGVHFQPLGRLAEALRRERLSTPGGLLLVVREADEPAAAELVTAAGLSVAYWP